ncbi:hypothetical protein F4779DRAFT_616780 [Xylariaceae sp. FL0662B]|nr:hypothetical protein F4779DRAFT_616780 [Xylariaceae sp. FL0662B]
MPELMFANLVHDLDRKGQRAAWGFYLYRTTYDDQDLWEQYVEYIRSAITDRLTTKCPKQSFEFNKLRSTFQFHIREDQASLKGRTIRQVRRFIMEQIDSRPPEEKPWEDGIRHDYFAYVDEDVLDNFKNVIAARGATTAAPPMFIDEKVYLVVARTITDKILSDENVGDDGEGGEDVEDVEMHMNVQIWSIPDLYDIVTDDVSAWFALYVPPPDVWES